MKAKVYGDPRIHFALTVDEIKLLIEHSLHHYDGRCRAASEKATGAIDGSRNGAFTIWLWQIQENEDLADVDRNEYPLIVDNATLQTALKCLEGPLPTYEEAAGKLFWKLLCLLNAMGRVAKDWSVEVEIPEKT